MAEKKTTAKKKATKKATKKDNKVIKEVAESIINESKVLSPVEPSEEEFEEAAKAAAEEILKQAEENEPIEEVEVMNGDPSVVIPSNEIEINKDLTLEIEKKAFRDTFKELNNENKPKIDRSFGYSWNGMEMD